uniref:Uncharacterized protein n=1 Tax=Ditylenchus dipsaci TaxID=166011 RepID=A0A915DT31_9BILA
MRGRNVNQQTEVNIGSNSKSPVNKVAEITKVKRALRTIAVSTNRKSEVQHKDASQAIEKDDAATSGVSSNAASVLKLGERIRENNQHQSRAPDAGRVVGKNLLLRIVKDTLVDQNIDTGRAENLTKKRQVVRPAKNGVKDHERVEASQKKRMSATIATVHHKAKFRSKVSIEGSAINISPKPLSSNSIKLPRKLRCLKKKRLSATIGQSSHMMRVKRDVREKNTVQGAGKRLETIVTSTSKQHIVDIDIIECLPISKNNEQQEERRRPTPSCRYSS